MIRWTQLNSLLPAMQFSLAPWDYGEECDRLFRRYAGLHTRLFPRIRELAINATLTGDPIIRPIWWLDSQNPEALTCDDQLLLGDDILIAPIVNAGQRTRDIYLPPGLWLDLSSRRTFEGSAFLRQFPAPLDTLPIFERRAHG